MERLRDAFRIACHDLLNKAIDNYNTLRDAGASESELDEKLQKVSNHP